MTSWMIQFCKENEIFFMLKQFNTALIQASMAYSANIMSLLYLQKEILNLVNLFFSLWYLFFDILFVIQDFPDTSFCYILIVMQDFLGTSFYYILTVIQDFIGGSFFEILFVVLDFPCTLLFDVLFYFLGFLIPTFFICQLHLRIFASPDT